MRNISEIRFKATTFILCTAVFSFAGCASTTSDAGDLLERGTRAFDRGHILESYRLLKKVDVQKLNQRVGEYERALAKAVEATEHLIERWLANGDYWISVGNSSRALEYYDDVINQLEPGDPMRRIIEDRARPVRQELKNVGSEIESLVHQARVALASGRIDDARQNLLEARWQSNEHQLVFSLEHQGLLEECDRRLPGLVEDLEETADQGGAADHSVASSALRKKRKRPRRKRRRRATTVTRPKELAPPPEVKKAKVDTTIQSLLQQGQQLEAVGKKFDAVLTYRRILAADPDNLEAWEGLERLAPYRRRKVAEWMRKASEHFAKEELEKAAPYYRRVLLLDPTNLRAKEGQQMYRRLKELKRKQG